MKPAFRPATVEEIPTEGRCNVVPPSRLLSTRETRGEWNVLLFPGEKGKRNVSSRCPRLDSLRYHYGYTKGRVRGAVTILSGWPWLRRRHPSHKGEADVFTTVSARDLSVLTRGPIRVTPRNTLKTVTSLSHNVFRVWVGVLSVPM